MDTKRKIVSAKELKQRIGRLRREGKKVVFTNGCFDILHFGHVSYLEAAKRNNRILVVGLNSDSSVRKIKGQKRPIVPQKERAVLVAALECVDLVTIFDEETPLKLIQFLRPDILVKGADWKGKEVVGSEVVKSAGGKIELISYMNKYSTTKIIESIIKKCKS
ncbi:MAG: D-glycero-beta-D-manno-heptose 1-phosphate adenylyltransferase [Candidatus Omnitrophota bacterium]